MSLTKLTVWSIEVVMAPCEVLATPLMVKLRSSVSVTSAVPSPEASRFTFEVTLVLGLAPSVFDSTLPVTVALPLSR